MSHGKVREITHLSEFCIMFPNLYLDSYRIMSEHKRWKKCVKVDLPHDYSAFKSNKIAKNLHKWNFTGNTVVATYILFIYQSSNV